MTLGEILNIISQVSENNGLSKPYLIGGIPRDKVLERYNDFNDVDITTGDQSIHYLAKEVAIALKDQVSSYQVMSDGHARMVIGGIKFDFSSNFKVPGINYLLKKAGIKSPTEMEQELYSRDFTCNTLLMTLDLKNVIDTSGLALKDIEDKILKTCLKPELTLGYDNKRIIRVIYLASKLQFHIDPIILEWIKKHPKLIANVPSSYLTKKLLKALKYDKNKTIEFLDATGTWAYVPAVPELIPFMNEMKRL